MDADREAKIATIIADEASKILAGKGPMVHGAVIVQLLGKYIAGCSPDHRQQALNDVIEAALDYSKLHVEEMIDQGHAPPGWREEPAEKKRPPGGGH